MFSNDFFITNLKYIAVIAINNIKYVVVDIVLLISLFMKKL